MTQVDDHTPMDNNTDKERPIQLKNILVGLAILPIIGIILYGMSTYLNINLSPSAHLRSQAKSHAEIQTKHLSELDRSETEDFRANFINECMTSAMEKISENEARQYCECTESRIEQNFTVSQVNSWENMSQQELDDSLTSHYTACASELDLSS